MRCENRIYSFDQNTDKVTYTITAGSFLSTYWDNYGLMAVIEPCESVDGSIETRSITTRGETSDTLFFDEILTKLGDPLELGSKLWLQVIDVTSVSTKLADAEAKRLKQESQKEVNERWLSKLDALKSEMEQLNLGGAVAAGLLDSLVGRRFTGYSLVGGSSLTLEFENSKVTINAEPDYSGYQVDLSLRKEGADA